MMGYVASIIMGFTLGIFGGGGSILTVPILVYLFDKPPVQATAYSLFVVGLAALSGTIGYARQGLIHIRAAIAFATPSFLGVYLVRRFLIPALPDPILTTTTFVLTKDLLIMLTFALIMILAAISMIRGRRDAKEELPLSFNYPKIAIEGLVVGGVTGFVGAGGGFLIIPALVLLVHLPMKLAVGTSLSIIAAKSLLGFLGDLQSTQNIEWPFLMMFSGLAIVGIVFGTYGSRFIPSSKLKPAFGWFILLMGTWILVKELLISN